MVYNGEGGRPGKGDKMSKKLVCEYPVANWNCDVGLKFGSDDDFSRYSTVLFLELLYVYAREPTVEIPNKPIQ